MSTTHVCVCGTVEARSNYFLSTAQQFLFWFEISISQSQTLLRATPPLSLVPPWDLLTRLLCPYHYRTSLIIIYYVMYKFHIVKFRNHKMSSPDWMSARTYCITTISLPISMYNFHSIAIDFFSIHVQIHLQIHTPAVYMLSHFRCQSAHSHAYCAV